MGAQVPKVFLDLGGVPIVSRTLAVFSGLPEVVERIVIVAKGVSGLPADVARALAGQRDVRVVAGGVRRQDSVRNGLAAVGADIPLVLVHDGARPFVTAETVRAVLAAAAATGAAITAVPARDTLKRVADGRVQGTVDRTDLWLVQTPQAFRADILRAAHARAAAEGYEGTDDAALVEHDGKPVAVVPGSPRNFKITTPDDLALARALVAGAGASGPVA